MSKVRGYTRRTKGGKSVRVKPYYRANAASAQVRARVADTIAFAQRKSPQPKSASRLKRAAARIDLARSMWWNGMSGSYDRQKRRR